MQINFKTKCPICDENEIENGENGLLEHYTVCEGVKKMKENPMYLKSLHIYNFRHGKENPKIIGLVNYKPANLNIRPCYKVEYESDNTIDYVPYSEVLRGNWEFV